jgi:hypothetical protein
MPSLKAGLADLLSWFGKRVRELRKGGWGIDLVVEPPPAREVGARREGGVFDPPDARGARLVAKATVTLAMRT